MAKRPPYGWMAAALLGGLLVGLLVLRGGAPSELTSTELAAARELWDTKGPASYTIELQMGGSLTDRRRIEVRDGKVVDMTVDGRPASEDSWAFWSVDGMFDFLEAELRNKEKPPRTLGVSGPDQVILRARFDADLGYPTHFLRHLMGRQKGTEWEVVEFKGPGR